MKGERSLERKYGFWIWSLPNTILYFGFLCVCPQLFSKAIRESSLLGGITWKLGMKHIKTEPHGLIW